MGETSDPVPLVQAEPVYAAAAAAALAATVGGVANAAAERELIACIFNWGLETCCCCGEVRGDVFGVFGSCSCD